MRAGNTCVLNIRVSTSSVGWPDISTEGTTVVFPTPGGRLATIQQTTVVLHAKCEVEMLTAWSLCPSIGRHILPLGDGVNAMLWLQLTVGYIRREGLEMITGQVIHFCHISPLSPSNNMQSNRITSLKRGVLKKNYQIQKSLQYHIISSVSFASPRP